MIDLAHLERIRLSPRPWLQRLVGTMYLTPNYRLPGRSTRIVLEGREHLPRERGAILVMNHTDRYNYWPLQYQMWREGLGFTATWVKGKYYEHPAMAWFMDAANNIPMPSRGYVLTKDFQQAAGRVPSDAEYAALKRLSEGQLDEDGARSEGGEAVARLLDRRWEDAPSGRWADSFEGRFAAMMRKVLALNEAALAKGLHVLIFPQGTRSVRLTPGHVGAAQVVLYTGAAVVPIGCSGSDRLYPGNSPWSRGGTVTYRIGRPLTPEGELRRFHIDDPFVPFTRSAERHEPVFRALTDELMQRINGLVDEPYRFVEGTQPVERGARRFV